MCDTLVVVPESGPVRFAKNSDREPGEAQALEHHPAREHRPGATVRCTWLEIPQARRTHETILSRPAWMWGAEMGVNAAGVAIGNEAVFTRLPVARTGLTGMDLLRLALERASTAAEALEVITGLLAEHPQGGGAGFRSRGFRYHNSYLLADPTEAWVLETAGPYWAAERVRGARTISNVLTIGRRFDRVHPEAIAFAREKGWCRSEADFDFARAFGDPAYRILTGGEVRRACTLASARTAGAAGPEALFAALSDHSGHAPADGWRMEMPCAHASWQPTRHAGQTTASLAAILGERPRVWATGTSAPCLSVFKPVPFAAEALEGLPAPAIRADEQSLWWRHERLHRTVLVDYAPRRAAFEAGRAALQEEALASDPDDPVASRALWERHRRLVPEWRRAAERVGGPARGLFARWWRRQSRLDHLG